MLSSENKIKDILENFNLPGNFSSEFFRVLLLIIFLLFCIIIIKALIAGAKFAKKVGYSMITVNVVLAAIPFLMITAPAFFQFNPIPKLIVHISMMACWGIVLFSNIFGCRFHVGYILLYTLVQLFLGFTIGIFGIGAIALIVIFFFAGGTLAYQRAETYNITLYPCDGGMIAVWDTENIIYARQNPNNSDELLGSEGEVLLYVGNDRYQLLYETREYEYYAIA